MIYFIRCTQTDRVKIGYATKPWSRLSKIQSDSPGDLEMLAMKPGGIVREAELHAMFGGARVRGEWFQFTAPLSAYVAELGRPERPASMAKSRTFWGGKTDLELSEVVPISRAMITRIRQGRRRAGIDTAIQLQRATGRSAIYLAFGEFADEAVAGLPRVAAERAA